jgi:hypothetical protein
MHPRGRADPLPFSDLFLFAHLKLCISDIENESRLLTTPCFAYLKRFHLRTFLLRLPSEG